MSKNSEALFENLNIKELIELLHQVLRRRVTMRTVYRWIEERGLPTDKVLGCRVFPKQKVLVWLERNFSPHGNR